MGGRHRQDLGWACVDRRDGERGGRRCPGEKGLRHLQLVARYA